MVTIFITDYFIGFSTKRDITVLLSKLFLKLSFKNSKSQLHSIIFEVKFYFAICILFVLLNDISILKILM